MKKFLWLLLLLLFTGFIFFNSSLPAETSYKASGLLAQWLDSLYAAIGDPMPVDRLPNAETFLLKVQGESMVNAGILDGDLVLVEQQATAENGEKIVALVNDSATVKTFYKEDGYFRLQPENDEMDPILVNDLQIVGKVIGVLRFLS